LFGARRLHASLRCGERARERLTVCTRLRLLALELREVPGHALRSEIGALRREPCRLALEAAQLSIELLEAGALHLRTAIRRAECGGVRFPALLPLLQRPL